jgi:hypothetical protein
MDSETRESPVQPYDMVGTCRGVQAWTHENGALAEAQPGISEPPPRNRSPVLKPVVFIGTAVDFKATYLLSIP